MSVRVLIADDQQLIRDGFRMILATDPDIEIIGEASNGAQARRLFLEHFDADETGQLAVLLGRLPGAGRGGSCTVE